MSAAVMPMRNTVSAAAICGKVKADATVSIIKAVVVRLFTGLSVRIAVIFLLGLLLTNSYAILCNGCANGESSSLNYRCLHNWSRVGMKCEHNA
jgi:hypothetical protein